MAKTVFTAEMSKWPEDQQTKTHNRWHPDIPFVETFKPGDEFRVESYDWTGGQIKNDDSANDIRIGLEEGRLALVPFSQQVRRGQGPDQTRMDQPGEAHAGNVARGGIDAVEIPAGLARLGEVLVEEAAAVLQGEDAGETPL